MGKIINGMSIATFWLCLALLCSCRGAPNEPSGARDAASAPAGAGTRAAIGFASREKLNEHFEKHGTEFGRIDREEYLKRAQALRDATPGGDILEAVRADGRITRFDRASGAFIAFDPDLTIRTFFIPNDGERYFRRQGRRPANR